MKLIDAALTPYHRTPLMTFAPFGARNAGLTHLEVSEIDSNRTVIHYLGGSPLHSDGGQPIRKHLGTRISQVLSERISSSMHTHFAPRLHHLTARSNRGSAHHLDLLGIAICSEFRTEAIVKP